MKPEELIAQRYLESLLIGDVVYEPDGNIPPDFAVNRATAVEVRRLNENYFGNRDPEGLEDQRIKLWRLFDRLTKKYTKNPSEKTYWLSFFHKRPLSSPCDVERAATLALDSFMMRPTDEAQSYKITSGLTLEIRYLGPAVGVDDQRFVVASASDKDRGGFVLPILLRNLEFCLAEKSEKIRPYLGRYPCWWLVLIDHVSLGLSQNEIAYLRAGAPQKNPWDKVILLDPTSAKEVYSF